MFVTSILRCLTHWAHKVRHTCEMGLNRGSEDSPAFFSISPRFEGFVLGEESNMFPWDVMFLFNQLEFQIWAPPSWKGPCLILAAIFRVFSFDFLSSQLKPIPDQP